MQPYIYGSRNDIHILDLTQTVPLLHQALVALRDAAAGGGRILFVGTKRQASEPIAAAAKRCAQYYVNHRWLGGTLTNWQTISNSIKRMRNIEETLSSAQSSGLKKKELLGLLRERDKLDRSLGGIKEMGGLPNMLFVIDTNKEAIAISEAKKLGIPVTAILDSNCDPDGIAHPIPGNDDAARALVLYCDLAARAIIDGLSQGQADAGIDTGAAEVLPALTPASGAAAAEVSAQ
jgi:small subunit ribosomal protein S2